MTTVRRIALLGPPAAGKSSLAHALSRRVPDAGFLSLDDEICRLSGGRIPHRRLNDAEIDSAVDALLQRECEGSTVFVELPHHDYLGYFRNRNLPLSYFDVLFIVVGPFPKLHARNAVRHHRVPQEYVARCVGASAALIAYLELAEQPSWAVLDSDFLSPEQMAELVVTLLRQPSSPRVSRLEVVPDPEKPYLGGHYLADVEWDETLARKLVEQYDVHTALDVGCGLGLTLDRFKALGVTCWGLEGNIRVLDGPCSTKERLYIVDFLKQWVQLPTPVDLIWCVEVLEHVPSEYEHYVVRTIASNAARAVFVSAAVPGQPGYHHVNCRPKSYWIDRIQSHGLTYVEDAHGILSGLGNDGPSGRNFLKDNGMLFEVRGLLATGEYCRSGG